MWKFYSITQYIIDYFTVPCPIDWLNLRIFYQHTTKPHEKSSESSVKEQYILATARLIFFSL